MQADTPSCTAVEHLVLSKNMIQLHKGDCLEVMQGIETGSIDAIITDPPYGTTACKWDSVISFKPMWEQLHRIIKPNGAIVLFGSEPFSSALRMSNIKNYKYDWVWQKPNGTNFLNYKYQPAKVLESISVFGFMATSYSKIGNMKYYPQMVKGEPYTCKQGRTGESHGRDKNTKQRRDIKTVSNGMRYPINVLKFNQQKGLHPTQKPVALMEYLIKTYTNEGEVVLDFTMGSGSTGVACVNTKRSFIGIEQDDKYFAIAQDRINNAQRQSLIDFSTQ
jgi:site-specific DNA-methyltransferase (adenine-specific)